MTAGVRKKKRKKEENHRFSSCFSFGAVEKQCIFGKKLSAIFVQPNRSLNFSGENKNKQPGVAHPKCAIRSSQI